MTSSFFFFNDPTTTEIYTLSLHDALPIYAERRHPRSLRRERDARRTLRGLEPGGETWSLCADHGKGHRERHGARGRSEEHTSELQSQSNLVCRLLLEKKKKIVQYKACQSE